MEKLPEEILIEIFDYLTTEDKEIFALVCESWYNILATSPSLMKRHHLRVTFYDEGDDKSWLQLPYRNFYLEHINNRTKNEIKSFIRDIEDVDKVVIKESQLAEVVKFLTHFENISMLITENFHAWESKDKTVINLPNLTHFKFDTSASALLPKIKNHKIKFMHVKMWENTLTKNREKDLGAFLQCCDVLKHLTLEGFYTNALLNIKSQVETFEVIRLDEIPESVIKFLEIQKSSLKNLSLSGTLSAELSNLILFEMNLEKVFIEGFGTFEIKAHKISVKNLSITDKITNVFFIFDQFPKLSQCFESLEVLSINLPDKPLEFLRSISMLPKLKVLFLKKNSYNPFEDDGKLNFTFNHLERLAFSIGFNKNEYVNIIRCCPNLKLVEIKHNILTLEEFERIFQICKKLQKISFIGVSEVEDEDIQTMKIVGEKINIKVEVFYKNNYKKFLDFKNRLTVMEINFKRVDPFVVIPKVLTHLNLWQNTFCQDYFYENEDSDDD